ncbi:very short patch repair endonuclease [Mesorhizobium sp.]|uniref:very short patch repair endonuclease n=1 Tax=Mesorhizobium sp. TaxID=1871066 RepID=UPI001214A122|nr:very short patch repair endonuclease [Mesorhizobium sp.]TIL38587.1 MAG: DNA mismatch endonuclease Vsr [Mesorhizobium sp.]
MDNLTSKKRSELMSRVRGRDTKPEMIVRKLLHSRGWRYRLHVKGLPGTPDIVFGRRKSAIFVNGCFWHGHPCKLGTRPKTRETFWAEKIRANRSRDIRKSDELTSKGWRVMTVWQCELADPDAAVSKIEAFLKAFEH